jgi:hypothetical protein
MTSPWTALEAATRTKDLYLHSATSKAISQACEPYQQSLQTLIDDRLDDTTGCFGTPKNPVAGVLEQAFNSRNTGLTNYEQQQLFQAGYLMKTASDAVIALHADNA